MHINFRPKTLAPLPRRHPDIPSPPQFPDQDGGGSRRFMRSCSRHHDLTSDNIQHRRRPSSPFTKMASEHALYLAWLPLPSSFTKMAASGFRQAEEAFEGRTASSLSFPFSFPPPHSERGAGTFSSFRTREKIEIRGSYRQGERCLCLEPHMDLKRRRPRPGGEQLDAATVSYFRRVGDVLDQGFEQEEEKGLFITNVLGEVRGRELELCTNASVSKVLERFLAACGAPDLRRFLVALQPHSAQLSCHRCGAHVVQTALLQVTRLGGQLQVVEEEEEETGGEGRSLEALIRQLSAGVRENFLERVSDAHGTFVVRTLLQVLGGVVLAAENAKKISHKKAPPGAKRDVQPAKVTEFDVPDGFLEELRDLVGQLEANVKVFLTNPIASPVFKIALHVLGRRLPAVSQGLCVAVIEYLGSLEQAEGC
ncbi:nucleolar protein 9-like, partial [Mustelus asterias]